MKLLVLDGNSILNRAYYGIKLLSTKDGHYTNAIYGFLTTLRKLLDESSPDAVAVAFDLKAPTFRHKAYDGYKSNRKGMPDELAGQMQPLKDILSALGFRIVTCEGFEADDILGTLAKKCTDEGYECIIATGDRDSLQLVSPTVSVRIAATKFGKPEVTLYDEDKIMEVYGVSPKQLIDIKAIQGDTSDCIPGVPGIGEKGAKDLITRFESLDNIYNNIDTIDVKPGIRNKLIAGKDSAYLSYMLGTINTQAPVDTDISGYVPSICDKSKAAGLMAKYELFSLMEKWGLSGKDIAASAAAGMTEKNDRALVTVNNMPLMEIYEQLKNKTVDFLYETDGEDITELIICDGKNVYSANSLTPDFIGFTESFLKDGSIKKRTHNCKPVFAAADKCGYRFEGLVFDTMLAAYLLNPNAPDYKLERLFGEYGISPFKTDNANGMESFIPLADKLTAELEDKQQMKLLTEIELPFAEVLASMENIGFAVDRQGIYEYGESMNEDIERLRKSICDQVGYEFNINSPKQLGTALFEKLMLPAKKKTKSGYSTNAEVLEELRNVHPVINDILEYRTLTKLKSTYCDGLLKVIHPDGRIHSSFNQTETRTGRISSTEPNLQNIPVKTKRGRELRKFFTAKDGYLLVDADYSQIELRVLASISNDTNMIEAFKENKDIHTSTAAKVFDLPEEMISPALRSRAKAVNFGIVYGIGAFSLSKDIGVTRKEADTYIKDYLKLYSGIDHYMKHTVEQAKSDGYVTTMFGRRRYLPELAASNHNLRAFGERVARNMPIQGTAADIIKIAMIKVYNRLKNEKMLSRLILQVHDELIVEAPENEAEKAAAILSEEMQNAVNLSVPLIADAGIGKTWYEAKT